MKAIFLDRDGTLIEEKHFSHKPEDIELEKNVVPALKTLLSNNYHLFMITNQSGIGRGIFKVHHFLAMQQNLLLKFKKEGIVFENFYYCPHHPSHGVGKYKKNCLCRKPNPGMINRGIKDFKVDPKKSFMVGDRQADVDAGHNAHMKSILLKTGYGMKTIRENSCRPDYIASDLLDAVENFILKS